MNELSSSPAEPASPGRAAAFATRAARGAAPSEIVFTVGRDSEGHWIARDNRGLSGGIFASREAAAHFAAGETDRRAGAVRFTDAPLPLPMGTH